jgi:SAM-dependent methyltransferase
MSVPEDYSFPRYLAAKKSVDDRALNRGVWQALVGALPRPTPETPLKVLEAGAGIGTMVERMLDWGALSYAEYTALDTQAENIACARERLAKWGMERGHQVEQASTEGSVLKQPGSRVEVEWVVADIFDFIDAHRGKRTWDLLVAHAFLDLVDIPTALPRLFSLLRPGGLFYFTINFDGLTLFEPAIDPQLDELIQRLYHRTMDERITDGQPSGDSRAGRHLFNYLKDAGAMILDAGASDWVVFPRKGSYPQDEAYFLHFILHTIQQALAGHLELDAGQFVEWIAQRHAQVERGELVYIAHQLDFVGKVGHAPPG